MKTLQHRTQILLPRDLQRSIERARRQSGEGLGEYLRKAAHERLARESKRSNSLTALAADIVGAAPSRTLTRAAAVRLQRLMRRDRHHV